MLDWGCFISPIRAVLMSELCLPVCSALQCPGTQAAGHHCVSLLGSAALPCLRASLLSSHSSLIRRNDPLKYIYRLFLLAISIQVCAQSSASYKIFFRLFLLPTLLYRYRMEIKDICLRAIKGICLKTAMSQIPAEYFSLTLVTHPLVSE